MRLRLTLITTGIVVAVYVLFAGALFAAQLRSAFRNTDVALAGAANVLAGQEQGSPTVTTDPDGQPQGVRGMGPRRRGALSQRPRDADADPDVVTFLDRDAKPRDDALERGDAVTADSDAAEIALRGAGVHGWTSRVEDVPYRLFAVGYPRGAVLVGTPVTQIVTQQRRLGFLLVAGGVLVAALVAGATALTAGWALKPVRRMRETAEAVAATEDPSLRVPVPDREDEVGRLARAFDAMLVRLRGAQQRSHETLESQRRFLADASHELRTPVTSLRGNLDLLARHPDIDPAEREQMLVEMRTEAARLGDLVEDVLDLTRVDGTSVRSGAWVAPAEVAGAVAAATRRRADVGGRDVVVVDTSPGGYVWTDPEVLRRVLDALVDNAVVHGRGRITTTVRPVESAAMRVEVHDEGPGVAPEDRDRVFERFARGSDAHARPGSGLGLSIAAALCAQVGATLTVSDDAPSTFVVALPVGHGEAAHDGGDRHGH